MKKYFYIVISLFMLSCYSDKGNYDYREINEMKSVTFEKERYFTVSKAMLEIKPVVKFSKDTEEKGDYRYEWRAVPVLAEKGEGVVIGEEKNLNYMVNLEDGVYTIYLRIKDKSEDILWLSKTMLEVSSSRGYLLVGDNADGFAEVDMVVMPAGSSESSISRNIFAQSGLHSLKGAQHIMHTGTNTNNKNPKIWLMTNDGSYHFDQKTYETSEKNIFSNILYTSFPVPQTMHPVQIIPHSVNGLSYGANRFVMCDNGYVFSSSISSVEFYGNPLNRFSTSSVDLFKTAPFAFYMGGNDYGISALTLYDLTGNRFVGGGTSSGYMKVLVDKVGDIFTWQQPVGTEFIYGENTLRADTRGGNSMAILKSGNDYNVFELKATSTPKKVNFFTVLPLAENFSQAKLYAFSSNRTIIFYSVGSVLYAYDYNKGVEKCVKIKDFGDEITMLKFDIQSGIDSNNALFVATYHSTNGGKLQKLVLDTNPNTITVTYDEKWVWDKLCRVKNMDWKN